MSDEVSCQTVGIFFERLRKEGRPAQLLLESVPYPLTHLQKRHARMDWDAFARLMSNAGRAWTAEELKDIGMSLFSARALRAMSLVARFMFSASDFYRWVFERQTGAGDQSFHGTFQHSLTELAPDLLQLDLSLKEGFTQVPEFYQVALGNFTAMPRAVGCELAEVSMTPLPRGARYIVKVPPGGGLLRRLRRFLLLPLTAPAVASELKGSLTELKQRYEELSDARTALADQTERLKIVNRLGRELAQHTTLPSLAAALSRVFDEEVPAVGIVVWVTDEDGRTAEPLCRAGSIADSAQRTYELTSGGEKVGLLELFAKATTPELALIEDLVPWVSIALGNARSFALVTEYRDQLSQKVEARTSELNATMLQLEESLKREREAIRRKTEFFDNVSHELRTPLTLILLTLESLRSNAAQLPAATVGHLERMEMSASRLLRLINELLDLAKLEAGKVRLRYQPVDLSRLLAALLIPFTVVADHKQLALKLSCEPVEAVHADPEKLDAIFQNLLSNALKFTSSGEVVVRMFQDGLYVHVEVRDTGIGIAPKDLSAVFERFAQADEQGTRRFGGTGIGLALVRETVELLGGNVQVESEEGRGSTFRVSLPRGTAHIRDDLRERRRASYGDAPERIMAHRPERRSGAVAAPLLPPQLAAPPERAARVLVVEDDAEVRGLLQSLLGPRYALSVAADGREGLEAARAFRPDLILSDVMMPVMSGLQMMGSLRAGADTSEIPVILLTARDELEAKVEGLSGGANDYISKPFSPKELLARIDTQLRLREATARLAQSERLAALALLTSGFAHEVRNPLNGLLNALPPLREAIKAPANDATAEQMLEVVEESVRRVRHLAETLLAMVRTSALRQTVDIDDTVSAAERALRWRAPSNVAIRPNPTPLPSVAADPGALTQVWVNLLDNALRAAGDEGIVEVDTGCEGDKVLVRVRDSGHGIAPEHLPRLFEPFFSTRPAGEGTGLGLALCHRIISAHGGTIDVSSRVGEGTVVTVRLPAERAAGGALTEVKSARAIA